MSIKIMSIIWECGPSSMGERFVLLAIADYANDDGEAWPSIASLMKKTTLSERGLQTNIRRLEASGWLKIETGKGRKNTNLYRVNTAPKTPQMDAETPHQMHPAPNAPPQMDAETPQMSAENPAPNAPEPSRTIIEPSFCIGDVPPPPKKQNQKKRIQLPEGWTPSPKNESDAQASGLSLQDIAREAVQFYDHHRARGNTMLDWDAAWRTWCRNAIKFRRPRASAQKPLSDLEMISRKVNEMMDEGIDR